MSPRAYGQIAYFRVVLYLPAPPLVAAALRTFFTEFTVWSSVFPLLLQLLLELDTAQAVLLLASLSDDPPSSNFRFNGPLTAVDCDPRGRLSMGGGACKLPSAVSSLAVGAAHSVSTPATIGLVSNAVELCKILWPQAVHEREDVAGLLDRQY